MKRNLTDTFVAHQKTTQGQHVVWDTHLPGFGIRGGVRGAVYIAQARNLERKLERRTIVALDLATT